MKRESHTSSCDSPPKIAKRDHNDYLLDEPRLDHKSFPWDFVTPLMTRPSLVALRATCRDLRDHVDSILFEHIVICSTVDKLEYTKSRVPWRMLKTSDWVTVEGGSVGRPSPDSRQIGRFGPLLPRHSYAPWHAARCETTKKKANSKKGKSKGGSKAAAQSSMQTALKNGQLLEHADQEDSSARRLRFARIVDIKGPISFNTLAWFAYVFRKGDNIQAVRLLAAPNGAHTFHLPRFKCDTLVIFSRDFAPMLPTEKPWAFQGLIPPGFKRIVQNITLPWSIDLPSPAFRLPEAGNESGPVETKSLKPGWELLPEVVLSFGNFEPLGRINEEQHAFDRWLESDRSCPNDGWWQLVAATADALRFGSKCTIVGLHDIELWFWFDGNAEESDSEYGLVNMLCELQDGVRDNLVEADFADNRVLVSPDDALMLMERLHFEDEFEALESLGRRSWTIERIKRTGRKDERLDDWVSDVEIPYTEGAYCGCLGCDCLDFCDESCLCCLDVHVRFECPECGGFH